MRYKLENLNIYLVFFTFSFEVQMLQFWLYILQFWRYWKKSELWDSKVRFSFYILFYRNIWGKVERKTLCYERAASEKHHSPLGSPGDAVCFKQKEKNAVCFFTRLICLSDCLTLHLYIFFRRSLYILTMGLCMHYKRPTNDSTLHVQNSNHWNIKTVQVHSLHRVDVQIHRGTGNETQKYKI